VEGWARKLGQNEAGSPVMMMAEAEAEAEAGDGGVACIKPTSLYISAFLLKRVVVDPSMLAPPAPRPFHELRH
jgi:hypothetical protein